MKHIKKTVISAMLLCIGLILPFATGQIKVIGSMLLPMHLPVMICGLICGPLYGFATGAILPILRSLLFGMPLLYPSAVAMAFELAVYGLVIGLVYRVLHRKGWLSLYVALFSSMLAGRVVWGIAQTVLLGLSGSRFAFSAFLAAAFFNAVPGILLQIVLVPAVTVVVEKTVGEIE
ncbi:MAG: ECF transporter S component [Clostridia bacterium]|nr:ECF transporter S component [Clostridia bacterium]